MAAWRIASNVSLLAALLLGSGAASAADLKFVHVLNIGAEGVGEGQFKYIEDFAFTKDGRLLATDASHAWVQEFDKTSGKFLARFGGKGDAIINSTSPKASRSIQTATYSWPTTTPASSRNTTPRTSGC